MPEDKLQTNRPKPVMLVVLDGWGIYQPYSGNAVSLARTPTFDNLITNYPSTTLGASGEAVGLPWGEYGNSEVGHLNLGLGRILYQDLPRINKAIGDKSFYHNDSLVNAVQHVKRHNSKLHLIGLVSDGNVHSSIDHLHALLVFAKKNNIEEIFLHAILDGRDTSYNSGINFIQGIQHTMAKYGVGKIATISGRFYAMDRNNHWDRTKKAYLAMTDGIGKKGDDPMSAIRTSYKKRVYDEEFEPTVICKDNIPLARIEDNDAVICFNYRSDRSRQLTKAFVLLDLDKFSRPKFIQNLFFVCFTEYEKNLPASVAFPFEEITNTLGDVLSGIGLKQLRIAETEKYAHVTYFFNGGREIKSEGEEHVLTPSPQVPSYDLKPEMSAPELTKKVIEAINSAKYDFILLNYANADMVGHTGNLEAAIQAIEALDKLLAKVVKAVLEKNGVILITADHGNAEIMFDMQIGQIDKEHTTNPVPFIIVDKKLEGRNIGWQNVPGSDLSLIQPRGILSDVASTILKIMGITIPKEMTGRCLI